MRWSWKPLPTNLPSELGNCQSLRYIALNTSPDRPRRTIELLPLSIQLLPNLRERIGEELKHYNTQETENL